MNALPVAGILALLAFVGAATALILTDADFRYALMIESPSAFRLVASIFPLPRDGTDR